MDFKTPGIRYGLIVAAATVGLYLIAYFIDKSLFVKSAVLWIVTFAFYLIGMRQASLEARTLYFEQETETPQSYRFSLALQAPFLVFLIAQGSYAFFQFFMIRFLDPSLIELTRTLALQQLESTDTGIFSKFMTEDVIETAKEAIESQDFTPKISSTLLGLAFSLLGGFLISCVYAAVFRRETNHNSGVI
jgi:hypothetical protein